MKISILKKIRRSLFLKILILFTLAIILAFMIPRLTHKFFFHFNKYPVLQKNVASHARYIINDIGTPPDIQKARILAKTLWIQIRFESPVQKWASPENMIDFKDITLPVYENNDKMRAGNTKYGFCVRIERGKSRYLLVMRPRIEEFRKEAWLFSLAIIAFIILLIIGIYGIMRWLLKPIKTLSEGVKQLTEGNIGYEMTTRRRDELGQLIHSFNQMTERIRKMIQARERLLLDVSHELRSPLTRIKIALEFLKNSSVKKKIKDDIAEMETKITELLETERLNSKHGKLKLARTDIFALLKETCAGFQNQKPDIRIVSFPENVFLKVDRERLKILFRNILDNALRYSDAGGYPVEISLREKPDEYTVAIQDFGRGIPEGDIPFIFEPFYRVDKSRSKKTGGYGLGMSLSKKIMEAHGGTIEIASQLKVGTTIFLKFKK